MPFCGQRDDRVRRCQDRRRRTVVLLERQHGRRRHEGGGEVEDVAHLGGAERVDRLGVVADDGEVAAVRAQAQDDLGLQAIGVLVLVDEHMVEARRDLRADDRVGHRLGPPDEQVVEVEDTLRLLLFGVGGEQAAQCVLVVAAPGKGLGQHVGERSPGVDGARVDRQAGPLLRKPARSACQAEALTQQVDQVLGVGAIVDGERLVEADPRRDAAQQARADAVEGAAPRQPRRLLQRGEAQRFMKDAADAPLHLERGAARERQQEKARRVGARQDEAGDARGQRQCLAGSGAGDDEERADRRRAVATYTEGGGALLGVVQLWEDDARASGWRGNANGHRRGDGVLAPGEKTSGL